MFLGGRVHWIDLYESLNIIILNYQSSWFISQLYIYDPLNWDTKDILLIDDHVWVINYKSLAMGFLKCQRLEQHKVLDHDYMV